MAILMYTEAMKYSPVNLKLGEGETMAMAAANRFLKSLTIHVGMMVDWDAAKLRGHAFDPSNSQLNDLLKESKK